MADDLQQPDGDLPDESVRAERILSWRAYAIAQGVIPAAGVKLVRQSTRESR